MLACLRVINTRPPDPTSATTVHPTDTEGSDADQQARGVARVYDGIAPGYLALFDRAQRYRSVVERFLEQTTSERGRRLRVLDVGCGPGHLTAKLHESIEVVGLDLSPEMVDLARGARITGCYEVHDFHAPIPSRLGRFDAVLAVGTLDFARDLAAVFMHLSSVLRDGGLLLASVVDRRADDHLQCVGRLPISPISFPGVDMFLYTEAEVGDALQRAGLVQRCPVEFGGYESTAYNQVIRYGLWEARRSDGAR